MGIHCRDIKIWHELLIKCKEELERIYGERAIGLIPLHGQLDREIKEAVVRTGTKMSGGMSEQHRLQTEPTYADKDEIDPDAAIDY
mgnify:CR=1 FL=1